MGRRAWAGANLVGISEPLLQLRQNTVTFRDQGLHATASGNIKGSPNELLDTAVVDKFALQPDTAQQQQGVSLVPSLPILPR